MKYCTVGTFWNFLIYPQGVFSGPPNSHEISGITQRFQGECLTAYLCCSEVITRTKQMTFFLIIYIFNIKRNFITMQLMLI